MSEEKKKRNKVLSATPEQDQKAGCYTETAGSTPLIPG